MTCIVSRRVSTWGKCWYNRGRYQKRRAMSLPFRNAAMWFSRQLPLSSLIELCRVLRHNLGAGLALRDVFAQQAERGSAAVRPVAGRIRPALDRGGNLESALEAERGVFPPLFVSLAGRREDTGHLPAVFARLGPY